MTEPNRRHTVVLVEDEPVVRDRLVEAVTSEPQFELIATCSTLAAGMAALDVRLPDLLLTDLGLPDGDGIALIERVRNTQTISLVVSIFGDESTVIRAIEAGAAGYLLKNGRPLEIGLALRDVISGGAPISPAIARHLLKRFRPPAPTETPEPASDAPNLTKREREVLEWLSRGFTFAETAEGLGLSHHTIGNHVRNIYRKLDVSSRASAVFEAMQLGIIKLDD